MGTPSPLLLGLAVTRHSLRLVVGENEQSDISPLFMRGVCQDLERAWDRIWIRMNGTSIHTDELRLLLCLEAISNMVQSQL